MIEFMLPSTLQLESLKVKTIHRKSNGNKHYEVGDIEQEDKDFYEDDVTLQSGNLDFKTPSTGMVQILIIILGLATCAAFVAIGVAGSTEREEDHFGLSATDITNKIQSSFADYVNAASLIHNRCRNRDFTRRDFRELYEYLIASGLHFKAIQFDPNVTHANRATMEAEARAFYAENYPHVNYRGFIGFNSLNATNLEPRTKQDYYFPIHYMEPIRGNEAAIDLDYHSSESRIRAVRTLFEMQKPSLTDRLSLVKEQGSISRCGNHDGPSYGVVLMHPGVRLTTQPDSWPRDFASIVICIPDLLIRSTHNVGGSYLLHVHDRSHPSDDPVFLGGARIERTENHQAKVAFLNDSRLEELRGQRLYRQTNIHVANRVWTVTVIALEGTYEASHIFIISGGVIIFLASVCVSLWVFSSERRVTKFNALKSGAEAEKAALVLENARQATRLERELNDFIAHEVRNPVAAAMAACTFVKSAMNKKETLQDEEERETVRDDLNIIDNALHFVNDLLRDMLDMNRAVDKKLNITMESTDILHDVLEPVCGLLHQRGSKMKIIVECTQRIYILTDRLRLKQVVLNLGRNSIKFTEQGFIRLKAEEVNGSVRIYVDDSGSGIPTEKRKRLFAKFQESLDVLNQGTGVGLFLCKNLVELMGGEIFLDHNYNSGIPGCPGTRFVIDLKQTSMEQEHQPLELHIRQLDRDNLKRSTDDDQASAPIELPHMLSVLFVDDDPILRKLFSRSIKKILPNWTVREAANGETALQLTESDHFDLIFMDMYMASTEKQLLGTETVAALREKGVDCRICGLSANDKEIEFLDAGADTFLFKPFPCDPKLLTETLQRILYQNQP